MPVKHKFLILVLIIFVICLFCIATLVLCLYCILQGLCRENHFVIFFLFSCVVLLHRYTHNHIKTYNSYSNVLCFIRIYICFFFFFCFTIITYLTVAVGFCAFFFNNFLFIYNHKMFFFTILLPTFRCNHYKPLWRERDRDRMRKSRLFFHIFL